MSVFAITKFAAKLTIAGGVVYWSVQQGVWGTTREGVEAYIRLKNAVVHPTTVIMEKMPSAPDMSATEYWNSGATNFFRTLSDLPEFGRMYKEQARFSVTDENQAPQIVLSSYHKVDKSKSSPKKTYKKEPIPYKSPEKKQTPLNIQTADTMILNLKDGKHNSKGKELTSPLKEEPIQKAISFKLSRVGTSSDYRAETIVLDKNTRSPANSLAKSSTESSSSGSSKSPIRTSNKSPERPFSPRLMHVQGYNFVTSTSSPPKPYMKIKVASGSKATSGDVDNQTRSFYNETERSTAVKPTAREVKLIPVIKDDLLIGRRANSQAEVRSLTQSQEASIISSLAGSEHMWSFNKSAIFDNCFEGLSDQIRGPQKNIKDRSTNHISPRTVNLIRGSYDYDEPIVAQPQIFITSASYMISPVLMSNFNPRHNIREVKSPRPTYSVQSNYSLGKKIRSPNSANYSKPTHHIEGRNEVKSNKSSWYARSNSSHTFGKSKEMSPKKIYTQSNFNFEGKFKERKSPLCNQSHSSIDEKSNEKKSPLYIKTHINIDGKLNNRKQLLLVQSHSNLGGIFKERKNSSCYDKSHSSLEENVERKSPFYIQSHFSLERNAKNRSPKSKDSDNYLGNIEKRSPPFSFFVRSKQARVQNESPSMTSACTENEEPTLSPKAKSIASLQEFMESYKAMLPTDLTPRRSIISDMQPAEFAGSYHRRGSSKAELIPTEPTPRRSLVTRMQIAEFAGSCQQRSTSQTAPMNPLIDQEKPMYMKSLSKPVYRGFFRCLSPRTPTYILPSPCKF